MNNLEIPIGSQESEFVDTLFKDDEEGDNGDRDLTKEAFFERGEIIFSDFYNNKKSKYKWIDSKWFDTNAGANFIIHPRAYKLCKEYLFEMIILMFFW